MYSHPASLIRSFVRLVLGVVAVSMGAVCGPALEAQQPIPQIDPGGPASFVTALAFSPDGQTLYAAGWDKVVRVWRWNDGERRFAEDTVASRRVPIGPGLNGAINALAMSPDGQWLAVGGRGVVEGGAGFRDLGRIVAADAMTRDMKADQGTIYLFHTITREVRTLRGHYGEVLALTFAHNDAHDLTLVSAARERDERAGRAARDMGVVRAWHIESDRAESRYLGGITLAAPTMRPALEAWRVGNDPAQVRAAIAWGDGQLRMWDVARKSLRPYSSDGNFDNLLARYDASRFVMAHTRANTGEVALWGFSADGRVVVDRQWTPAFPSDEESVTVPRLMAPLGPGDGSPRQAAVVLLRGRLQRAGQRSTLADKHYQLQLVDLSPSEFGRASEPIELWSGESEFLPALATAPAHDWIAVAGNDTHTIHIYRSTDLGRDAQPFQTLGGDGVSIMAASFVHQGGQPGLRLRVRSSGDEETQTLVLNVPARRVAVMDRRDNWQLADAPREGWSVKVRAARETAGGQSRAAPELLIQRENHADQRIRLEPGSRVTAYALVERNESALLAVASRGTETAQLSLFDVSSGSELRRLTAHSLPIRSLQFSADARLLVSAGDDGFVCCWSLDDLSDIWGQHGAPGVMLDWENEQVVIAAAANSAADLVAGDALLGQVQNQQFTPWTSLREAFDACWQTPPGQVIRVRRQRGGRTADVALPVIQGVDERKPLCTLFVAKPDPNAGAAWPWIVFTPVGPYDASGAEAERYLGWHINTGQREQPTSFARADQYRNEYRREGLLAELLAAGRLPRQADDRPLPRPSLQLSFAGETFDVAAVARDRHLVREVPERVLLDVVGIEPQQIERIELVVDEEVVGTFREEAEQLWTAELESRSWQRGTHTLEAMLWTREAVPQHFAAERRVAFYPAAPSIEHQLISGETTSESQWDVEFRVKPANDVTPFAWTVRHRHDEGVTTVAEQTAGSAEPIRQAITLKPGRNTVEIEVRNRDLTDESRALETSRVRIQRLYEPQTPAPLLLTINEVRAADDLDPSQFVASQPDGTWLATTDSVLVKGTFTADVAPARGTWKLGEQQGELALADFQPDQPIAFTSTTPVPLTLGDNQLQVSFQVNPERIAVAEAMIRFQPPLPEVNILAPEDGLELTEGQDPLEVELVAQLSGSTRAAPAVALLINGRVDRTLAMAEDGTVRARVKLTGRETSLAIRLARDELQQLEDSPPVVVLYRRPPRVAALEVGTVGDEPFVDASTSIATTSPLSRIEVFVNQELVRTISGAQLPERKDDLVVARLDQLPLNQGDNQLAVHAYNQDGRCLEAAEARVMFTPAPPPRPVVQFLDPVTAAMTTANEYEVALVAQSKSPLRELRILLGNQEIDRQETFDAMRERPDGLLEIEKRLRVRLEPGVNRLRAVAVNAGGQDTADVTLTCHPHPVRVEIVAVSESRDLKDSSWKTTPRAVTASAVRFDQPASGGRVWLHGRVLWDTPDARLTRDRMPVHIWVNGFHQIPVQLDRRVSDARERTFSTSIVLNQSKNNLVEVNLPRLSTEADCPLAFQIDCTKPISKRRLHLAVIGVGLPTSETEQLEQRALDAFQAKRTKGKPSEFSTPAFERGWIYGPLTGPRLTRYLIQGELQGIKRTVNNLSRSDLTRSDPMNDVVVIYYEGGEIVTDEQRFYLTTKPPRQLAGVAPAVIRQSAVSSEVLSDLFLSMGGAHLMFLDVVRGSENETQRARLPDDRRTALLRFAWLRNAEAPREARLITALGDPTSQSPLGTLTEVDQRLSEQFVPRSNLMVSKPFGESLIYENYIPAALGTLLLGEP